MDHKIRKKPAQRRFLKAMLLTILFLPQVYTCQAQWGGLKQKVDLRVEHTTALVIITSLGQQSGCSFYYTAAELGRIKINTFQSKGPLGTALQQLKAMAPLDFRVSGNNISVQVTTAPAPVNGDTMALYLFKGHITDAHNHKPVPYVEIYAQESHVSATTDGNGDFTLQGKAAHDLLIFSRAGYASQVITANTHTAMDLKMMPDNRTLSGVTVSSRRRMNSEVALLNERQHAATVSDGISAENIEKTASITTTQALQRVSGVTVTDDKYVAVRGLGDRSVIGQLNGIRLASSDPDRSTIPLDLVPANLLDNIVVYKTMTPDKPADASGGIVELKTLSIPTKQTLSFTAQTGLNANVGLGGKVNSFYNSDMGFWGNKIKEHDLQPAFMDLNKQYPGGLSQIQQLAAAAKNDPALLTEIDRINGIMHHFDPVLTTRYKRAPLNGIYNITYGNSFSVFKQHKLGLILSGSYYNRTTDVADGTLNQYSIYQGVMTGNPVIDESRNIPAYITPNTPNLGKYVGYKENTGTQTLSYGLLGGLAYRFNPNHEISFQYMGSRGGETQATSLSGQYAYVTGLNGPVYSNIYSLKQTYRTFNTYNLQGEHKFGDGKYAPRLSYNGASSKSTQDDPDYRFINLADYRPAGGGYYQSPVPDVNGTSYIGVTDYYAQVSGYVNGFGPYGKIQADPNGRRFRGMTETNYNYKADVSLPFGIRGLDQVFKVGVNYLYRERDFSENVLSLPGSNFSTLKQYPMYQVYGNLDRLVGYDQVGIHLPTATSPEGTPLASGFLYNIRKSPNNYTGFYETNAFYGMLDLYLMKNLRLAGGVRFEKTNIQSKIDTAGVYIDPSLSEGGINLVYTDPVSKYISGYKPYYSANLTYSLHDVMNFRLAYGTSLARPEIRELTNVFEFDPFQQALVVGNPHLVNQQTKSYDFRWEWFPNKGEVLAASFFAKEINSQLEKVFIQNSDGVKATYPEFPTIAYQNNPNTGHVWGIELEVVKNLGLLWRPLQHFFLGSNLMIASSNVDKNNERLDAARIIDRQSPEKSPLFEQAPYSVNGFLNYANEQWGTDFTATFNMVGERLIQVNMDGAPDLYSRPTPVLDLVFSQKLAKRLVIKGFAKNLLNSAFEEVYSNPGTGGKYYGTKYVRRSYRRGTEYMLGLTYNLF
ncbi:carboxypeptidase-like regulatory domain-containing protein [Chitinophaga sp. Ak27]|uniref:carboxypeptidase-like regulatory domain-containing protein n=1 Tax=Chitinophaga sp. Ak27 TaxID=2726116 RepID=UPI001B7D28A5|nr:carboxypeptidase-like regulatory domain-containing protein [Chitinophaga sp. Ak27]